MHLPRGKIGRHGGRQVECPAPALPERKDFSGRFGALSDDESALIITVRLKVLTINFAMKETTPGNDSSTKFILEPCVTLVT
jgi:hypothetical protein